MPAKTETLVLPENRIIAWCEYGSSSSPHPPIFYLHGSPSSRYEGALYHGKAVALNLRIISPDRPSSGFSTPDPGRTFLTYPADIIALADHLSIPKFHIIGSSGGCPYLLACLQVIPRDRLLKAQVVSGVWPLKLGTEGMRFIQKALLFVSYYTPQVAGTLTDWTFGAATRDPDPNKLHAMLLEHAKLLPTRDREACQRDGFMDPIVDACREAFRQGDTSATTEFGLWARDWGFELQDIDARGLTVWHGREDGNCGFAPAEKAAALLKGAETRFLDEMGHYILAYYGEEILRGFLD